MRRSVDELSPPAEPEPDVRSSASNVIEFPVRHDHDAGSGLGLSLCRRIAARFGGVLELDARPSGGTRATVEFAEVA